MKSIIVFFLLAYCFATHVFGQAYEQVPTTLSGYYDVQSSGAAPQYLVRDPSDPKNSHVTFLSTVSTHVDSGLQISYAYSYGGYNWHGSHLVHPPLIGTPALELWSGSPVVVFNRLSHDTVFTSLFSNQFGGELSLPRFGGLDEPQNPRIATTADGRLFVVAVRPISDTAHTLLFDPHTQPTWSEPLPVIHFGDQYVVAANDSGRVAIVWSSADTVGFLESFDNGETFNSPVILFATQIINGDLVHPGKGLDAVYVGNALFVVWSAIGSTPRSARILSWNPVGGLMTVADSSKLFLSLASSMHPQDDHFVLDRPSIGRYKGSASVGCAFVVFKEGEVDNEGWNYGDIYVAEGWLEHWNFCYNATNTPTVDERYVKVASHNPPVFGLFMIAYQADSVAGPNLLRDKTSVAIQYVQQVGVIDLSVDESGKLPFSPALYQNYPNPFNPRTTLRYSLTRASHVRLMVYDILGREVAVLVNRFQSPGTREAHWDAYGLPSGLYFYRVQTPEFTQTKKMLLIQ
ncbi:MAG: T9SS type A sorting domain-containing protein [Ignavibacteriae bacterium]|nr:T9SS type A sorting domain-containing protein [Ignavibacteriota bacterium]